MNTRRFAIVFACCVGAAHAAAPAEQTIPAARLVGAARAALPGVASHSGMTLTTSVVGTPVDAVVPAGTVALLARAPTGRWPRARVAVPVEVLIDGKVVRNETVWFAVTAKRYGLVYGSDAPIGTPASKLKLSPGEVDVAAADGAAVETAAQLADERLKRGVHAGWPVLENDFEAVPDVDKNARVVVRIRYGAIRMQALATALQAGDIGDAIPVLVEGADAPVQAQVEARGVVDIAR